MFPIKLDSAYLPLANIEGYFSLVWTERYRASGDFELKTLQVDATMKLLPLDTLISHQDTSEVMIVETATIELNEEKKKVLTLTGRTFETFFENRVARPWTGPGEGFLPINNVAASDPADESEEFAYYNMPLGVMAHDLLADWSQATMNIYISEEQLENNDIQLAPTSASYFGSIISNYEVRDDTKDRTIVETVVCPPGHVYERLLDMLELSDLGVRNVRPNVEGEREKSKKLLTRIYEGTDRTKSVILSTKLDHFLTGSYIKTIIGSKNTAAAFSYYRSATYQDGSATGRNKRIGYVDVTRYKKRAGTSAEIVSLRNRGKSYVKKRRPKFVFGGKVASTIPFVFGKHYFLGDIVRVLGEYDIDQSMRVVEYIRTEDKEGDVGSPSLEIVS